MSNKTIPPLDMIKALGHSQNCTVNEVVLAIIGAALDDYLAIHGESPDTPLIARRKAKTAPNRTAPKRKAAPKTRPPLNAKLRPNARPRPRRGAARVAAAQPC